MNYIQVDPRLSRNPVQGERDFLADFLHRMDVLIVILDGNGHLIRFNKACERLFGYSYGEIHSRLETGMLPLPGESVGTIKSLLKCIRYANDSEQYETEWPTKQGDIHTISWSVKTIMVENGMVEYILATGTDITNLKIVEKKLQQEQLLLSSLINSMPDLVFYKDVNGVYLGCNQAFESFSGRTIQGENAIHTDFDFYPPEMAQTFADSDRLVLSQKQTLQYENPITRPNGDEIVLETRKIPYFGPENELLGVIGISRDVTQQKKSEQALRKTKAEIEQLIASLSSILIVLSLDKRVLRWNPSAQLILGIPQEEAIGVPLADLDVKWNFAPIAHSIDLCEKDRDPKYLDPINFKRVDDSDGYLGINISPIFEDDTELTGYILLGGDITERKTLEVQLTQMQKMKSIGQLAAGIAHEINTPIQYIGDNTSFLKKSLADLNNLIDQFCGLLDSVNQGKINAEQVQTINATISQIDLDFLRTEMPLAIDQSLDGIGRVSEITHAMKEFSHPGVVEKVALDINKAVENTITVARNEWKYVAEIKTDLTDNLPEVICLPGEISQALLNIIVNAAQAIGEVNQNSPEKKGIIAIKTNQNGEWFEIHIADTGPGIPESVQPHIFEPFYTTKEVGKGTGQGLAIAYNIIEIKHGGRLFFHSKQNRGTVFTIRLPIKPPETNHVLNDVTI
jgi:PAS domain S-box-containing protein